VKNKLHRLSPYNPTLCLSFILKQTSKNPNIQDIEKLTVEKLFYEEKCVELSKQLKRLCETVESSDLSHKLLAMTDENKRLTTFVSELEEENLVLHEHLKKVEQTNKILTSDNDTLSLKLAELGFVVRIAKDHLVIENISEAKHLEGLSIDELLNEEEN